MAISWFASGHASADAATPLPDQSPAIHEGVASCAGSTCHGSISQWQDRRILQNEYVTWSREDAHTGAFKTLHNELSQRIARKLGLASAETADECLTCHADHVPAEQRGERFQVSDGVGCEACHGGAEKWLKSHTSGKATHAENIDQGLFPVDHPAARARLCLSCHLGLGEKRITHRIMGAGHPRLSFELDTFTDIQPAHFSIDDDYRERKPVWSGFQIWAVGQVVTMQLFLDGLVEAMAPNTGLFPELVFFDCHACHHSMRETRWGPRGTVGLGPGTVRLNDASLLMVRHIAARLDPAVADDLRAATRALHRATEDGSDATRRAAGALNAQVAALLPRVLAHDFTPADMRAVADAVLQEGIDGEYRDYVAGEQATMALASIGAALHAQGDINDAELRELTGAIDKVYAAVRNDDGYRPAEFVAALREVSRVVDGR